MDFTPHTDAERKEMLAAIGVVAFIAKRLRLGGLQGGQQARMIRVVSQLNLGAREKISIVEVDDQWLVLGVTAQQVTLLSQIARKESALPVPEPVNFSTLFKQMRGKHE